MTHTAIDPRADSFGHVEHVTVHFDDLDAVGILHNARYAVLLERALTPYWAARGISFQRGSTSAPDVFHAVREFAITFRAPITGIGPVAVHFWLDHFGTSSAEYGFQFRSADGRTVHAEGRRAIVRLDPATLRPTAWTDAARAVAATLLRPATTPA
ncbi:hotdog domain-containing protein [Micromonospora sp. KC213]|uniref:acyl-CoA thioesterase n=1 Tax=Micromonospora sp. KC213 TaxID=2530378 RepID=UPI001047F965|nr:hotdog domain-containing protein [Micromonospora sp. KC213]TDC42286.1 acyl-CoA thioesterase [Micromonospora sp. KC213]